MRVRTVRGFVWAGRCVEPGEVLDVSPVEAHRLIYGYGDAVALDDDAPSIPAAMVTHGDPVNFQNGDPVAVRNRRRR